MCKEEKSKQIRFIGNQYIAKDFFNNINASYINHKSSLFTVYGNFSESESYKGAFDDFDSAANIRAT